MEKKLTLFGREVHSYLNSWDEVMKYSVSIEGYEFTVDVDSDLADVDAVGLKRLKQKIMNVAAGNDLELAEHLLSLAEERVKCAKREQEIAAWTLKHFGDK